MILLFSASDSSPRILDLTYGLLMTAVPELPPEPEVIPDHYNTGLVLANVSSAGRAVSYNLALLETVSLMRSFDMALLETAVAFENLATLLADTPYSEYRAYVVDNNVLSLFSDAEMQFPFPFIFSLALSTGQYFRLPDAHAAVYVNGQRNAAFSETELACQFTSPIADNSEVVVISDYCLRLCTTAEADGVPEVILPVWTNIPAGSYLSTKSANVAFSLDGVNFAPHVKLTSDKLFIRGRLEDEAYGYNKLDVVIRLLNCEVLNAVTL